MTAAPISAVRRSVRQLSASKEIQPVANLVLNATARRHRAHPVLGVAASYVR
jgi:hypothetical protein